ncbi:unnamed protein product [Symbiodinium sp. KB8]|nr:unnamed protein product [Symbiodinium sp. KB8]
MVFLWLCSVAHPVHRVTLHGQRCRLKLPQDEWLQRILQHEGVAVSWHEPKPELTQKFSIVGLIDMDCQSLQVWSGPLTSWSKESMVLHNYYHSPVDSFIIRASSVFCFDEEVPVYTKIDGRSRESAINGSDGIFFPCGVNIERVGSVTGIEMKIRNPFHQGQRRCELHETMQRWGISREGLGKLGAHLVPEPVCKLLLRGKWQDLLFMSRWFKGPFARRGSWAEQAGVRLPDALWAVAGEHEALQDLEPLELQHLQRMLDHIRRWSPAILAQCETEDAAAGEQLLLESFATWLRQLMAYFAPHFAENATDLRRHLGVRDAQHGLQLYSDRQLVGMVLFAWHLRDSVGFKEAAPSALEAMFPKFFSLTGFGTKTSGLNFKAVINDMKKVKKMLETQAQKIAAAKAKPASKGTAPVYSIFQLAELCQALPSKGGGTDGASKFQANEPGIMNIGESGVDTLFVAEVKVALSQLSKLMKEAIAGKAGSQTRAEVTLDEAAIKAMADPLKKLLPDNMRVHTGGTDGIQTDSGELTQSFYPCLRFSWSGTREIILTPYLPLAKHVQDSSAAHDGTTVTGDLFDPKVKTACIQFLKFCSKEKFQSYLSSEGARAFHGTIGPSDMLFIPPGWIFAEITKDFVLGLKCPVFVMDDGDSTQKLLDQLKSCSVKELNKSADAYAQAAKSQAR